MTYFILLLLACASAMAQDLPTHETSLFSGSGNCAACHVSNGGAMFENGRDISPVTQWRSTMMANSAKDPLWRAKVATELSIFPQHSDLIQQRCTVCHIPIGHTQVRYDGFDHYDLFALPDDPFARDGVSCTVCHQIQGDNLGTGESYGGGYEITDERVIFGPYAAPLQGPMINNVGYTPTLGTHVNESELCATCHTLFTPSLDADGNIIGEFPEQTPYIEWKNSFYGQEGNVTCQACHMRASQTAQDIALMPPWHQELRSPYHQHLFTGANVTMLKILRDHAETLGVTALAAHFDTTIAETERGLREQTCALALDAEPAGDSVYVSVTITNLTGHKLPTGIPLRRMWIRLQALNASGDVIFESGGWNAAGEIAGYDAPFEPHHDLITEPDQVQVYEAVMADNLGNRTWTLLRAIQHPKDNRLPPLMFTSTHESYDSCAIYGVPPSDTNFNRANGSEGSGSDIVTYRLPNCAQVTVSVMFQTVQPELVNYLAGFDLPETNAFLSMYNTQSHEPMLLTTESLVFAGADDGALPVPDEFRVGTVYPNPFNSTAVLPIEVSHGMQVELQLFDIRGRRAMFYGQYVPAGKTELRIDGEGLASGVYLLQTRAGSSKSTQRVIFLK
ncbi:MAG: T9SS type A sorting domain-containing protein [Calditrichaeota bacterium]|nr:T9SS type A sorting domain-containing protein [Calditrichota bacterium]